MTRGWRPFAAEAARSVILLLATIALSATVALSRIERPLATVTIKKPPESITITLVRGRRIELRVMPLYHEGYGALARRVMGAPGFTRKIQQANGMRKTRRGVPVIIPWDLMKSDWKIKALTSFFPKDRFTPEGALHQVRFRTRGSRGETLRAIARWYAGDPALAKKIKGNKSLKAGDEILVPAAILSEEFQALLPSPPIGARGEDATTRGNQPFELQDDSHPKAGFFFVNDGPLEYRKDDRGAYAAYYLKPGEALYSTVVVRFTGRVDAEEVAQLAELIAVRSDIEDVTDIPVGYRIKIPFAYLMPRWLPPGHPERAAYEETRKETASVPRPKQTKDLAGVAIILDPGHGGEDAGAMANGTWESDYVYDIAMRIRRILNKETAATTRMTVKDQAIGYKVVDRSRLIRNQAEVILTTPPYRPVRGSPGVHFRWYLSNYFYRDLLKNGQTSDYVVFTSIHADSLHPSLRGAMIYVPGRNYRTRRFSRNRGLYATRREVKIMKGVSFTKGDLIRSEGLSRQLAAQVLSGFGKAGLKVHDNVPIRDHVVRRGRSWTPAVIKYSAVPTSILIEVANLNNRQDAKNLKDPKFREKVARAYVDALRNYFGRASRPKELEAKVPQKKKPES